MIIKERSLSKPSHKSVLLIFFILAFVVSSVGCAQVIPPTQEIIEETEEDVRNILSAFATQTQEALSAEALGPSLTPSPPGTEAGEEFTPTVFPMQTTETVQPGSTEGSTLSEEPTEIQFKSGGTSAHLRQEIKAGEQHRFTFLAAGGQTLILSVSANNNTEVYLEAIGLEDGQTLLSLDDQSTSTTVTLPSTQEYQVTAYAPQTDTIYFLHVEIPAVIDIVPGERISLDGNVEVIDVPDSSVLTRVRYLVSGKEGMTLKVKLESPQIEDLNLGLVGQSDGQAYWRHHVIGRQGELEMPLTQGYYLDVYSTSGNSAPYTLEVEIK
jgi:hypothetical protein